MTPTWGRVDNAGTWPNRRPVWTLVAFLPALVSGIGVAEYRHTEAWTPLQRFYLAAYLRARGEAASPKELTSCEPNVLGRKSSGR